MQQVRNFLLFIVLSCLLIGAWLWWQQHKLAQMPREQPQVAQNEQEKKQEKANEADKNKKAEKEKPGQGKKPEKEQPGKVKKPEKEKPEQGKEVKKEPEKANQPPAALINGPPLTPAKELITLGSDQSDSPYHLGVELDPRGAGVVRVVDNRFQEASSQGLPLWHTEKGPDGKPIPLPLGLVPKGANYRLPSNLLYAYDVNEPRNDMPFDTLGRIKWKQVGGKQPIEEDGKEVGQRVSFEQESQGVIITKTFSLRQGEYHIGLEVKLRLKDGAKEDLKFRYQLTGAKGLPVEGKWYTNVFRNALIAQTKINEKSLVRDFQDLRQISQWGGGNEVSKQPDHLLRYAAVAVQYFASVIVVDDKQEHQDFLHHVRPTLETALVKGTVKSVARNRFVLTTANNKEETFYVPAEDQGRFDELTPGMPIAVTYHAAPYDEELKEYPQVATAWSSPDTAHALWVDDITVRVATEPIELKPGKEVVHKYLLYNGPVKVSLLGEMKGVSPALVQRYHDLGLDTLTDYQSPGGMGSFSSTIGWTRLIIWCTNLMHWVLGWIHALIPNYGICIIVLTILVRGLMFPISRKQALTTMRMQELAPELKRLQEKFKDDRQSLGAAQMELYRRHGINPFGTCWFLLLQMPVFMGLYYALQESVFFRLAEFWPTWIKNLAAPDMMFSWGTSIPVISQVKDYGGFFYLGPYFNLLPVVAVALMIVQQRMMSPVPQDDQQRMQQSMMKYMMIFFGLMFYKVAAGLCLYFIASSVWGFAERRLLPKKQAGTPDTVPPAEAGRPAPSLTPGTAGPEAITTPGGVRIKGRNRRRQERGGIRRDLPRPLGTPGAPVDGDGLSTLGRLRRWWRLRRQRLSEWWQEVLEQARKK